MLPFRIRSNKTLLSLSNYDKTNIISLLMLLKRLLRCVRPLAFKFSTRTPHRHGLINREWTEEIVKSIVCQPGFDLSSTLLCQSFGGQDLLLEEFNKAGISSLWKYKLSSHGQGEVTEYRSPHTRHKVTDLKDVFTTSPWQQESPVKVLDLVTTSTMKNRFIRQFISQLSEQIGVMSCGRVPFYVMVPGLELKLLTSGCEVYSVMKNKTPWRSYLYPQLAEIHMIMQIPMEAFEGTKSKQIYKQLDIDWSQMYLVKLTPRADLYTHICEPCDLKAMVISGRYLYYNTTRRLIATMETLLPDVGPLLINAGYTMNDTVGDIDFFTYHKFFKLLQSYPGYSDSPFHNMFYNE